MTNVITVMAELYGISPLLSRTTSDGVEECVHVATPARIAEDGTLEPAHVTSSWLPSAPDNRRLGAIPGSFIGEPLSEMRMSPDAPPWTPEVSADEIAMWRDRITADLEERESDEHMEFASRYGRDVESFAEYVTRFNLHDFDVVVEMGSSRRVEILVVDRWTRGQVGVLTEEASIGIGLYAGTDDLQKVIANLVTKADFVRGQHGDYASTLEDVLVKRLGDWVTVSNEHHQKK